MIEWQIVPSALFNPHCCVTCRGVIGPMLDTMVKHPQYGRVYLCRECVKKTARLFGFAEGDRLEELAQADSHLVDRDKQIAALAERLRISELHEKDSALIMEAQDERLGQANARIAQLEKRIADEAKSALELVAGGSHAAE